MLPIILNKEKFVREWNSKYPYDRWWRKKYNIPFGSKEHREANFIDMAIDFAEDMYYAKMKRIDVDEDIDEAEKQVDELIESNTIKYNKEQPTIIKMDKSEIDKEFDEIDISEFNSGSNNG